MQNVQDGAKKINDLAQILRDRYEQQVNQLFTGSIERVSLSDVRSLLPVRIHVSGIQCLYDRSISFC